MTERPTNPYAHAYKNFLEQTQNHKLTVLHEDGLYRHLRIQAPGTRMWSWDITTWPGYLATSGDIADGYMFSRELDMIDFFSHAGKRNDYYSDGAPSIDVRYWAEKLSGGRSHEVKEYSQELFLQQVREHLDEHEELGVDARNDRASKISLIKVIHKMRGLDEVATELLFTEFDTAQKQSVLDRHPLGGRHSLTWRKANDEAQKALFALWSVDGLSDEQLDELVQKHSYHSIADESFSAANPLARIEEILEEAKWHSDSEHQAHEWLARQSSIFGEDTWEWSLREYDTHFLFTCYCIDLGVRLYREHVKEHGTNDTYVLVRDVRVQNHPSQPVIDLDFLDFDAPSAGTATTALAAREQIMAVPQARKELPDAIQLLTELIQEHGDVETQTRLDQILTKECEAAERIAREEEARAERAREGEARQAAINAHGRFCTPNQKGATS